MRVKISLDGCDDSTEFEMFVTDEQFTFLKQLVDIAEETSDYGCQPTMEVTEL